MRVLTEPKGNQNAPGFSYSEWLRIRGNGAYDSEYNEFLRGKSVIVVGASPSLEGQGLGSFIDGHDLVARINKGFPTTKGIVGDIGSRTDIHYHCLHTKEECGGKVFFEEMKREGVYVSCPYPKFVQPFYNDVSHFERENKEWGLRFHTINTDYYMSLSKSLGTRPNSGTLAVIDLLAYDIASLYVTGFTWFRDGWRKSYKDMGEIFGKERGKLLERQWQKSQFNGTHSQKPQEQLIKEIYLNDSRVDIDQTMKSILEVE